MTVRKITVHELPLLTQLFDYSDIAAMISENTRGIKSGGLDIFALFDGERSVGELHAAYVGEDERAVKCRRVYLFAFRIRKEYQGRGLGKKLLQNVIDKLTEQGYTEFTIGVEDDNTPAKHIYESLGFTELIARKKESFQGDSFEFGLYLRRQPTNAAE